MGEIGWNALRNLLKRLAPSSVKREGLTKWAADLGGDCEAPRVLEMWARKPPELLELDKFRLRFVAWQAEEAAKMMVGDHSWSPPPAVPNRRSSYWTGGPESQPLTLTMHVRCRRCSKCGRRRSRMWYTRALLETEQAQRTWFGTITLNEQNHYLSVCRAERLARRRGLIVDRLEELPPEERFALIHRQNGVLLQLWLKRVRKTSKATLRFLLVCEAHKSGLPHYHCLVHEQVGSVPVSWRTLSDQWEHGFTQFKLVTDAKQAGYLCKYLSKDARARVRSSKSYGQRSVAIVKREIGDLPKEAGADTLPCKP